MTAPADAKSIAPNLAKALNGNMREYFLKPSQYFILLHNDQDIREWTILVCGLDDPFKYGEYLFRFHADSDFPAKPPKKLHALTENGVFMVGVPGICVSHGEFHSGEHRKDNWRPVLGMSGFADNFIGGLIQYKDLGHGIGINPMPQLKKKDGAEEGWKRYDANIRAKALTSKQYNFVHHAKLMEQLDEFVQNHPKHPAVIALLAARAEYSVKILGIPPKKETTIADMKADAKDDTKAPGEVASGKAGDAQLDKGKVEIKAQQPPAKVKTVPDKVSEKNPVKAAAPAKTPAKVATPAKAAAPAKAATPAKSAASATAVPATSTEAEDDLDWLL